MAKFSKRHYEPIATILNERLAAYKHNDCQYCDNSEVIGALEGLSLEFCNHFSIDNPAFDRIRFLKACGVQS